MALFSDIDWLIIAVVGVFFLFGKDSGQMLRTLGRWYGRAGRIKDELLGEFAKAADLPRPPPGAPVSVRGMLLGLDSPPVREGGIRVGARTPPGTPPSPPPVPSPTLPWTGGAPVPTWTMTVPVTTSEVGAYR